MPGIQLIFLATFLLLTGALPARDRHSKDGSMVTYVQENVARDTMSRRAGHTNEDHRTQASNFSSPLVDLDLKLLGLTSPQIQTRAPPQQVTVPLVLSPDGLTRSGVVPLGELALGLPTVGGSLNVHQDLQLVFDTASLLTVVPAINCDSSCDGHDRYDPDHSVTVVKSSGRFRNFDREGGLRGGSGITVLDDVHLTLNGHPARHAIKHKLGVAQTYPPSLRKTVFLPDGVFSMSYQSTSGTGNQQSLAIDLWNARVIDSPQFTFLPVPASQPNSQPFYLIFFGSFDASAPDENIPVIPNDDGYWKIRCDLISVGRQRASAGAEVILSTGYPFLKFERAIVKAIYARVRGAKELPDGRWDVPCQWQFPNLEFKFGSTQIVFKSEWFAVPQYIYGELDRGKCFGAVVASNSGTMMIGDLLLRHYRVKFDLAGRNVAFSS